jgi:HK97 family phage major capsid protein
MAKYKGVEINTSPSDGMVDEAERGLDWREEYGRGGTAVGVARARDIINGRDLSINTVKRMYSFFARHEVDKQAEGFSPGEEGYPSAGRIAWALWGGDPGFSWSKRIVKRLDSLDDRSMLELKNATEEKDMTDQQVDIEEVVEAATEVAEVIETPTEEDRAGTVEVSHRAMEMEAKTIDEDTRRVRIAISSEEPVSRSFGMEVLEHSEEAINLSFLASGRAPLLLDHDPEKQIGVIESVDLDSSARRLRATVRFGKGALAKEAFDDVMDGIRANISVGYAINKLERKDKDTYVAKSWMPMEASLVSIPADVTVGVGRSSEPSPKPVIKTDFKENPMSDQNFDIAAVEAEARKAAQRNAAQIVELGAKHGRSDLAQKAIAEGRSIEEFRGELLDVIGSTRALEEKEIGMSQKEVKRFSLLRAIHALANPTDRRAQEAAAFEFECSQAAAKAYGRTAQGILLPAEVLRNWKRDLNSSDEAALFTDDFRGGDFIDALRNASSVMQAGATMLSGLSGDVKIPKKTGVASTGWISSEGGAASESEMTVGSVSMTPKTLGAFTDITRQLMIQSSLDVEALVRDDLAQSIALAIDLGALAGSGSSGQPTGIKNTGGINVVDFGTAPDLIPTYAQVVELETKVREDNALGNGGAYIANATMYGALKSVEKAANTAQFVVEPGGTMNGYRTVVSNQVASGDLYFGDFRNNLLIGMFGGLDIVVDPYTASTSGTVRVVALQSCDVAVRHATAFCIGNDGGS